MVVCFSITELLPPTPNALKPSGPELRDEYGNPLPGTSSDEALLFFAYYFGVGLIFVTAAWAYFVGRYRWGLICNLAVVTFFAVIFLLFSS